MSDENERGGATPQRVNDVNIDWDDSAMESIYANIGTATANREEFFLLFGLHQNWRGQKQAGEKQLDVKLSHRVVMSPFAAKRLALVLNQSLKVYEDQFGKIEV
ncbi:hypothetical protein OG2516_11501 [Oceanicola granulosus HTCC2516]|uniref:DUF3467 domain-containing protein n=1 Tax=Oceanicola granulosus (strain ATCC BAA-861 / DSM 15982 / KCTC 12143 / HTCC2516) TaxID=314256 RepID=Q2CJQ3_OCEGH|nr:DUF3467 domain-containing protein [Oceanicola granulosus]EAR53086.1 hypothetical protein OG2516_11501 [Oceanicola granulosus HTCC2516]